MSNKAHVFLVFDRKKPVRICTFNACSFVFPLLDHPIISLTQLCTCVALCCVWKVEDLQVGLTVNLRNQEGTLKLILLDYGCDVGELSIKMNGGAAWLYQV